MMLYREALFKKETLKAKEFILLFLNENKIE